VTDADTRHARLDDLFTAIDAKDTERFLGFLTAEASFRFGSAPSVQGNEAIHSAVDGFFSTIASLSHKLARVVSQDNVVICEGEVTYTRHDATETTLPFINVFEFDGDLISAYKIYMDIGPLYDP
jgi:limonene-1,2-epoxide hydrolase